MNFFGERMARIMKDNSNVLSFDQPGEFFLRKAEKLLDENNFVDALPFFRKAAEKEPENIDYKLALAEVFTEMNFFEESNNILFEILKTADETATECYFGLGCNFMGLADYEKAQESFEKYMKLDPEGEFAEEVKDLLEILETSDDITEKTDELNDANKQRFFDMAAEGKSLLDKGDYKGAIEILKKVTNNDKTFLYAKNNLALSYYCNKQYEEALLVTREILKKFPTNTHANCNMALFCAELKDKKELEESINRIIELKTDDIEDMQKISLTLCELKQHEQANRLLKRVLLYKPFDVKVLHYTAVSSYNAGRYAESVKFWGDIIKIEPDNSIAAFYKTLAADTKNGRMIAKDLSYIYQVPFEEIKNRVKYLNECLKKPKDILKDMWRHDAYFLSILLWGLELGDMYIKKAVVEIIATFKDKKAEGILRKYILKRSEPDQIKNDIFILLKKMGVKEPYIAYVNGSIVEVKVGMFNSEGLDIPETYKTVVEIMLERMRSRFDDRFINASIIIWEKFIRKQNGTYRVIKTPEIWAAAVEYLLRTMNGEKNINREIAGIYNISPRSFWAKANAIRHFVGEVGFHEND
jgi:tetratricopeptide (TPR) repeat protein